MKNIILFSLTLVILGAGCQPSAEPSRQAVYEPAETSPFYVNNDYTDTTFELSMPEGWTFEEDTEAKLIKFYDQSSDETVTLQIYTQEDPTELIEAHMNLENKDTVLINEKTMTRLVGTGMDPKATQVTHIIHKTDYGWFVYSGYEYNENMIEVIESIKFYEVFP